MMVCTQPAIDVQSLPIRRRAALGTSGRSTSGGRVPSVMVVTRVPITSRDQRAVYTGYMAFCVNCGDRSAIRLFAAVAEGRWAAALANTAADHHTGRIARVTRREDGCAGTSGMSGNTGRRAGALRHGHRRNPRQVRRSGICRCRIRSYPTAERHSKATLVRAAIRHVAPGGTGAALRAHPGKPLVGTGNTELPVHSHPTERQISSNDNRLTGFFDESAGHLSPQSRTGGELASDATSRA